jgi:hypothetical protein
MTYPKISNRYQHYNDEESLATPLDEPQHAATHGRSEISMMILMLTSPINIFPPWPQTAD